MEVYIVQWKLCMVFCPENVSKNHARANAFSDYLKTETTGNV